MKETIPNYSYTTQGIHALLSSQQCPAFPLKYSRS